MQSQEDTPAAALLTSISFLVQFSTKFSVISGFFKFNYFLLEIFPVSLFPRAFCLIYFLFSVFNEAEKQC